MPGWIGVDLDGTLAHYGSWRGEEHIGEPIGPMVERVKRWLSEGQEVRIFTARANTAAQPHIEIWCERHIGARLKITATKDFAMIALWDDRCVQVIPNTGRPIDPSLV